MTLYHSNGNFGPILPRFRNMAGFLLKKANPPYSIQILGCSLGLEQHVQAQRCNDPKLIVM